MRKDRQFIEETIGREGLQKKNVFIEEQNARGEADLVEEDKWLAHTTYEYFRVTGTGEAIWDFSALVGISFRGDTVQGLMRNGNTENSRRCFLDLFYKMRL